MTIKEVFSKILLSLGCAFLFYLSKDILLQWSIFQTDSTGQVILYCLIANIIILGAFAFVGFAWPTYKLLPEGYYKISKPDRFQEMGRKIGLTLFQKFLLLTFWKDKKQRKRYFDGSRSGIKHWVIESKRSEFGHLIPFAIITGLSIWSLVLGFWIMVFVNMLLNIFINLYPVLLQRMHRARLSRIIDRL